MLNNNKSIFNTFISTLNPYINIRNIHLNVTL